MAFKFREAAADDFPVLSSSDVRASVGYEINRRKIVVRMLTCYLKTGKGVPYL